MGKFEWRRHWVEERCNSDHIDMTLRAKGFWISKSGLAVRNAQTSANAPILRSENQLLALTIYELLEFKTNVGFGHLLSIPSIGDLL